jgi:recombination protein RecT
MNGTAQSDPKKEETKALKPYEEIVGATMKKIQLMQTANQLHTPADYSPQNALQSAWLILQNVTASVKEGSNWNKVPVLTYCTKASIANALLDMVIQGFNPVKKQCAFIAYGKQLACQPEYFGNMLLAKRADHRIADDGIQAEVIFKGDEFEWEIRGGKRFITKHKQTFQGLAGGEIVGAYCTIISNDGEVLNTIIMTLKEIHQAWKKSRSKPFDEKGNLKSDSTHAEFPVEMCKKTVINRACKTIVNSSSDKNLLESVKRQEMVQAEEGAQAEIDANANTGPVIDIEPEPEREAEPEKGEAPDPVTIPTGAANGQQQRVPGF